MSPRPVSRIERFHCSNLLVLLAKTLPLLLSVPPASIFAWTRGLIHRAKLDGESWTATDNNHWVLLKIKLLGKYIHVHTYFCRGWYEIRKGL